MERRRRRSTTGDSVPYAGLLDQLLLYKKSIAENGAIYDEKGVLDAQLVEQPCGVSGGTGKLTFTDLTGITVVSSAGTATSTKNVNDIEFSAGTVWDLKLSDGTWIPDPYTGYDVSGSNHGTPTNVTAGTQDVSFYFQLYGFDRYTKKTTPFDVHNIPKTDAGAIIDVSGSYPSATYNHISCPTGNGIVPIGTIDFDKDNGTDVKVDIYSRDNVLGQAKEFWRTEVKDLASYDAGEIYQHDADEFCLDYLMTFGLEALLNRLFLKQHKTDENVVAISHILNYGTELTDAQKAIVWTFLKAVTKADYEAWAVFKDSSVVCAFNFKDRFSLFEEDGYLAELGWEGTDEITNGDCESAIPTLNGVSITAIRGSVALSTDQFHGGAKSVKFTGDGVTASSHYIRFMGSYIENQKYHVSVWVYIPSANIVITELKLRYYDGGATELQSTVVTDSWVKLEGSFIATKAGANMIMLAYCPTATATAEVFYIDDVVVTKIGDTVAKIMDVGYGGGSDTYLNGTQADLSLQPIRVSLGLEFNAINSCIDLGSDNSIDNIFAGGGTICAWIYLDSWGEGGYGRIADKSSAAGAVNGWLFCASNPDQGLRFKRAFSTTAGHWITNGLTLNAWHHVAVIYDEDDVANDPIFYVNGVVDANTEVTTPVGTANTDAGQNLYVGSRSGIERGLDGIIGSIIPIPSIKSESEIKAIYNSQCEEYGLSKI